MENLWNLDFSRWEIILLSLLPALINVGILLYVSFFLPQNKTNFAFVFFVLLVALWQTGDGFVRLSITEKTALEWFRVSGVFSFFVIPVGILFTLGFAGWRKKISNNLLFFLLFFPVFLFLFFNTVRLDKYSVISSHHWYWIVNPEPTPITSIIYLWLSVEALLMLCILWMFYTKPLNTNKRKQSLLLALGFTVPVVGGVIAEAVFPLVLGWNVIPITTSLFTVFSIMSLLAMKRYKMLSYSPKHQWNNIIESMNEGVLIVNNEDEVMYANKKFCEQMEYKPDEITGKVAFELFFNDDKQKGFLKKMIEDRVDKKANQYEIQLKKKTGKKVWMLLSGSPYTDINGKIIGFIGILMNISNLKEVEEKLTQNTQELIKIKDELERNELWLKEAQAIAHVGSWRLDFATKVAVWSDEACRIYGLLPEENQQSFESWLSFIHPEDLDFVNEEIKKSGASLNDLSMFHRIIRKDGIVKYIHSVSKFELNEEGRPVGIYGIAHDVTEIKEMEKKLFLSEMAGQEKERKRLSMDLHDGLGQMLVGANLHLNALKRVISTSFIDKKEYKDLPVRIDEIGSILKNTIREMRDISHNMSPHILEELGLTTAMQYICETIAKANNISISFQSDVQKKADEATEIILYRIFQELLTNIIKHSKAKKAVIKLSENEKEVCLSIEDDGVGIDGYALKKASSGMGLATITNRVNVLNGKLKISRLDKGTKIEVSIPLF